MRKKTKRLTFFNVTTKQKAIDLSEVKIKWIAKIELSALLHRRSQIKQKAMQIKLPQLRGQPIQNDQIESPTQSNGSNKIVPTESILTTNLQIK